MNDVELLRKAAALMRERAEVAGSGYIDGRPGRPRWEPVYECTPLDPNDPEENTPDGGVSWGDTGHEPGPRPVIITHWSEDADHIASWDPTVALAVADWLDAAGADLWAHGPLHCPDGCMECDDDLWMPHARRALAVARAYLRLEEA